MVKRTTLAALAFSAIVRSTKPTVTFYGDVEAGATGVTVTHRPARQSKLEVVTVLYADVAEYREGPASSGAFLTYYDAAATLDTLRGDDIHSIEVADGFAIITLTDDEGNVTTTNVNVSSPYAKVDFVSDRFVADAAAAEAEPAPKKKGKKAEEAEEPAPKKKGKKPEAEGKKGGKPKPKAKPAPAGEDDWDEGED